MANYIDDIIERHAKENGVDPATMRAFMSIESGGNPNNRTGSYHGLFQLSYAEFTKYGGRGNIYDPEQNTAAAARKFAAEYKQFNKKYGRNPTAGDLYMIHQQGEGGAANHWANPDKPAWMNMYATGEGQQKGAAWARKAIWGNIADADKKKFGSVDNVTSRDFVNYWNEKVARRGGSTGPFQVASQSSSAADGSPVSGGPWSTQPAQYYQPGDKTRIDATNEVAVPDSNRRPQGHNPPLAFQPTPDGQPVQPSIPTANPTQFNYQPEPTDQTSLDVSQTLGTSVTLPELPVDRPAIDERDAFDNFQPLAEGATLPLQQYVPDNVGPRTDLLPPLVGEFEHPDNKAGDTPLAFDLGKEAKDDPGALDKIDAMLETNSLGDAAQQALRGIKGWFEGTDPNFKVDAATLAQFPEQYQEFLHNAPNKHAFEERKADVLQRIDAQKIIEESGWGWKAANIGLEMAPYIAVAIMLDKGYTAAAVAAKLNWANRLVRMSTYAASSATIDQPIYELNKAAGNEPNWALTVGLGVMLSGALGAFGKVHPNVRLRLNEVADDVIRHEGDFAKAAAEAEQKGLSAEAHAFRDAEQPRDKEVETQVLGRPLRDAVDNETHVRVMRTADKDKIHEAQLKYADDMKFVQDNIGAAVVTARPGKAVMNKLKEVWDRQGHRIEEAQTYYVAIHKGDESKLLQKLKDGVVRLEKELEDAVSPVRAFANAGKDAEVGIDYVAKIQVPKGAKLMQADKLKWNDGSFAALARGDLKPTGKTKTGDKKVVRLKDKSGVLYEGKNGKGVDVEVKDFTLRQDSKLAPKGEGRPVSMRGHRAEDGKPLDPHELESLSRSDLSAGGVREDAMSHTYLKSLGERTRTMFEGNYEQLSDVNLNRVENITTMWEKIGTAAGKLKFSGNAALANAQKYLMYAGRENRFRELANGEVTPRAWDEMKEELSQKWDNKYVKTHSQHFGEFLEELAALDGKKLGKWQKQWQKVTDLEAEKLFNEAIYRERHGQTTGMKSVAAMAKAETALYDEMLEMAADPARAFGLPSGSIRPVAEMQEVLKWHREAKMPYTPRIWKDDKILKTLSELGNDGLRDWLFGAMKTNLKQDVEVLVEETGLVTKVAGLSDVRIKALADKMADTILKSRGGYDAALDALSGRFDINSFLALAREGSDVAGGAKIDDVTEAYLRAYVRPPPEGTKAFGSRTRSRAPINENFTLVNREKYKRDITIHDFVETDSARLMRGYINNMSGRIAGANTIIKDADGKVIVDGFTSDAEITAFKNNIAAYGQQHGVNEAARQTHADHLDNFFDTMLGRGHGRLYNENAVVASRWLLAYTTFSKMGKSVFNQLIELGNAVADGGVSVINNIPQVVKMQQRLSEMSRAGDAEGLKSIIDLMEHDIGLATQVTRSSTLGRNGGQYLWGGDFVDAPSGGKGLRMMQKAARGVVVGGGMIPLTANSQRMVFGAMFSRLVRDARKYGSFDKMPLRKQREYRSMGLDDIQAQKAIEMMKNKDMFQMSSGTMMGRLDFVNTQHKDFDEGTLRLLTSGLRRRTTNTIQENKYGAMHPALDSIYGRMLMQFKTFTYGSITQQWTRRVRQVTGASSQFAKGAAEGNTAMMSDAIASLYEPTAAFVYQGALALLTYRAYLELNMIGMSDAERNQYLGLRWDKEGALRNAMISRAGPTGWLPTAWNTSLGMLDSKLYMGDFRTSGLGNTFIPASVQSVGQIITAAGKLGDIPRPDKEFSDKDAKKVSNAMTNFLVWDLMTSLAAQHFLPDDKQGR